MISETPATGAVDLDGYAAIPPTLHALQVEKIVVFLMNHEVGAI